MNTKLFTLKFRFKKLYIKFFFIFLLLIILKKIFFNFHIFLPSTYYSCFITMVRLENKYIKEVIEYYRNLGIDKFFIGDDNKLNTENISEVLKDYINESYVEILDIREKHYSQKYFFLYSYNLYKSKCKWIFYFDIDEYLEFKNKTLKINDFLSQEKFNKCEVIKINWLMYNDNDLLYYENRSLQERFTTPIYYKNDIRTVKSIVRGNLKRNPWILNSAPHEPAFGLKTCDSLGNISVYQKGTIYPPIYNCCYIKHYSIKSTEEFGYKIKKGYYGNKFNIDNRINYYFTINKFSKEKLILLEKIFNKKFTFFHNSTNIIQFNKNINKSLFKIFKR